MNVFWIFFIKDFIQEGFQIRAFNFNFQNGSINPIIFSFLISRSKEEITALEMWKLVTLNA